MCFSISIVGFLSILTYASPALAQSTEESEPNDTPATADTAVLGGTATGHIGPLEADPVDQRDYWVVWAERGDTIHVYAEACERCDGSNVLLALFAPDGVTRVADGQRWNGEDPQLSYVVPGAGLYVLRLILDTENPGSRLQYTLHFIDRKCPEDVGEPNNSLATAIPIELGSTINGLWCPSGDGDVYKLTLDAGTVLEFSMDRYLSTSHYYHQPLVHLLGPNGENLDAQVEDDVGPKRYEVQTTGTYYLNPVSTRGGINYTYRLQVGSAGLPEVEPNDDPAHATAVTRGTRATGTIGFAHPEDDRDYWAITVNAGDTIFADVDANELGSAVIPSLTLYGSDGTTVLSRNGGWDGFDPQITFVATATGTYYIAVTFGNAGPGLQPYGINFSEVRCPLADDAEPNDTSATAKNIAFGATIDGIACPAGDGDWYRFAARAGSRIRIQMDTVGRERPYLGCACEVHAWMRLYAPDGSMVLAGTGEEDTPTLTYDIVASGDYYVRAAVWPGGIRYPYTIRLTQEAPPTTDTITVAKAVAELFHPGSSGLSGAHLNVLDEHGNRNRRYDVGDLRAYLIEIGLLAMVASKRAGLGR